MRDHTKLRAFELADALAMKIYTVTRAFPKEEQFGLTTQMRRAAVSVASNIVEGCARHTEADYWHFLDIAYGSSGELQYQLTLAWKLNYVKEADYKAVHMQCEEACKVLNGLLRALRR
ncbi:MAG: four helix bundle protein [Candidatus Hydrogenedentes bacterium]|nr:four helix bundle protein [Candidatus Hydrogenedentota bacterium]